MTARWQYGRVLSSSLNVRKAPSLTAPRWDGIWPINRIALVKPTITGWYETLYRGEPAFVKAEFIQLLSDPVPERITDRIILLAVPELGRNNPAYFNGYSGKWCHRFADWLVMHAGIAKDKIPNTGNCGWGIVWFVQHGQFYFKNAAHKRRMVKAYPEIRTILPTGITTDEDTYKPIIGDYVYFRWNSAVTSINVSHVGIVRNIDGEKLTTFEGNVGGKVVSREYMLNDSRIIGFGHPNYLITI